MVRRTSRWLRRHGLKLGIWLITLTALAWQYENWHDRRFLKEQRTLWQAEFNHMKLSDFIPPRVPDEENFFTAPVFEAMIVPRTPPAPGSWGDTDYQKKYEEALAAMPGSRFLQLKFPTLAEAPGNLVSRTAAGGLKVLDITAWADARRAAGDTPPAGLTDAGWLHSSFPADPVISGLTAALDRPKVVLLPQAADRQEITDRMDDPAAAPIPAVMNPVQTSQQLALRARAAARAGDSRAAREVTAVLWRLTEGFDAHRTLVSSLIARSLESEALDATAEGIASRCWDDADLARMAQRLTVIDEESALFTALNLEAFLLHMWHGDLHAWHKKFVFPANSGGFSLYAQGPEGWIDANLGNHILWWRMLLVPDKSGDDLLTLKNKLDTGIPTVRKLIVEGHLNPRKRVAAILVPELGNVVSTALEHQTRRRQLLLSLAMERFLLSRGHLPVSPADLVPALLPAIPGDPWEPGAPLRWEAGSDGIRYRILSAGPAATLALPDKV